MKDSSEKPSNWIFITVQQVRKFRKLLSILIQLDSGEHFSAYTRFLSFNQTFYRKSFPNRRGVNWKPTQIELCIKLLSVRDFSYVLLNQIRVLIQTQLFWKLTLFFHFTWKIRLFTILETFLIENQSFWIFFAETWYSKNSRNCSNFSSSRQSNSCM